MINWAMKPSTNLPSIYAKKASNAISPVNEVGSPIRGFISGALEGAGHVADDMTSPFGIASMVLPELRGARSISKIVPEIKTGMGIGPSELPSDLIGNGMESIYNAARNIPKTAKSVEDLAYEIVMNPNKIRSSIGGDANVAEMMQKLNSFRGR